MAFAPVVIAAAPPRAGAPEPETACAETLAITLVNGRHVVVPARIDPALLARLLPVLDGA